MDALSVAWRKTKLDFKIHNNEKTEQEIKTKITKIFEIHKTFEQKNSTSRVGNNFHFSRRIANSVKMPNQWFSLDKFLKQWCWL